MTFTKEEREKYARNAMRLLYYLNIDVGERSVDRETQAVFDQIIQFLDGVEAMPLPKRKKPVTPIEGVTGKATALGRDARGLQMRDK